MDLQTLGGLSGLLKGGSTKVSQSLSNTSYAAISANISGISSNPVTGAPSASQTPSSTASTTGGSGSGGLLDSIIGGGGSSYMPEDSTAPAELVAPAGSAFTTDTALYLMAPVVALGVGAWFLWKKM